MTNLQKLIRATIYTSIFLFTNALGGVSYKYTPIMLDDTMIMIPYAKIITGYIAPVNSIEHTTIVTTEGKRIRVDRTPDGFVFEGYVGKIVLLEVYGDTCPHCIAAIPSYNNLQSKYKKDVVVIALESYGTLTNASKQLYITIPKAKHGDMFSFIGKATTYTFNAVPYLMILDRTGDIVYDKVLADFPEAEIESRIQSLL